MSENCKDIERGTDKSSLVEPDVQPTANLRSALDALRIILRGGVGRCQVCGFRREALSLNIYSAQLRHLQMSQAQNGNKCFLVLEL